ncbi:hypothetical protein O3P69_009630 [Scylla paramamosain]|uniref:Uncharacterized protein n=1 Tax=Scylla paramamosain TaxID=85552 RepID=A0AAW0SV62_SCYPA
MDYWVGSSFTSEQGKAVDEDQQAEHTNSAHHQHSVEDRRKRNAVPDSKLENSRPLVLWMSGVALLESGSVYPHFQSSSNSSSSHCCPEEEAP